MTTIRKVRHYGWRPDLPDRRDLRYAPRRHAAVLPTSGDLRSACPPVYDQGNLASCTANGIGGAVQFDRMRQGLASFVPSRLFIYYNERVVEGDPDQDGGAEIRDGIKVVAAQGAPDEALWPYDELQFAAKPSDAAYAAAISDEAIKYERLTSTNPDAMRDCVASGLPFVFGFTVYELFESDSVASSGAVPMPGPDEVAVGGHCVLGVGYDDDKKLFLCRNSWAPTWGQAGYFQIPYDYLTNSDLADDFWCVQVVGAAA